MREAGTSLRLISEMAGYSGHNGGRDVATFLKLVKNGDQAATGRLEKFMKASGWTPGPEN